MASTCINGASASPEPFSDQRAAYTSYGWLSPRASFSRDSPESKTKSTGGKKPAGAMVAGQDDDFLDFEFSVGDPATMMTADELFTNGKLVPLQLASARSAAEAPPEVWSPKLHETWRGDMEQAVLDMYAMSPRAPTFFSSRWRELLRLRKLRVSKQENNSDDPAASVMACRNPTSSPARTLKLLLQRNAKSSSSIDGAMNLPLLRDNSSDSEVPICIPSRLSQPLSSSSAADHDQLPRLSLDVDKHRRNPPRLRISRQRPNSPHQQQQAGAAVGRVSRSTARRAPGAPPVPSPRSSSVDSPRMNSSGKVIFQGLGRSASSPSSFNGGIGGQRVRYRGMEFTPVLNVPVFGLGQLFSAQKKEKERDSSSSSLAAAAAASKGSSSREGSRRRGR